MLGKIGKFRQIKQNQAKQANLGKIWQIQAKQAKLGIYVTNLLRITNSDGRKEEKMKTEEDVCKMAKNKKKKDKSRIKSAPSYAG